MERIVTVVISLSLCFAFEQLLQNWIRGCRGGNDRGNSLCVHLSMTMRDLTPIKRLVLPPKRSIAEVFQGLTPVGFKLFMDKLHTLSS